MQEPRPVCLIIGTNRLIVCPSRDPTLRFALICYHWCAARFFTQVRSKRHQERYVRPGSPDAVRVVRDKLISTESRGIESRFRVTLLSKRYKPRFDEHPSAVGALRDLAWMEIVENFRAELKKKKLRLDDLEDYAAKHPLIHSVGPWKHEFWTFARAAK